MSEFPYGNDLAKVREWIGKRDSLSNAWHVQYLGGGNTLTECEFHFLLHGMDSLTSAYAVLKSSSGLGLPIGLRGRISLPRTVRDVQDLMSSETRDTLQLAVEGGVTRGEVTRPFQDTYANSKVWEQCFVLDQQKQFMTRWTQVPFSLDELDGYETSVNVLSSSFILIESTKFEFYFPNDREEGFTRMSEMGSVDPSFSLPGHVLGHYNCRWDIRSWTDNFYSRCPIKKEGYRGRFTDNRFLHYLPPYTGYLYRTREAYLSMHPDKNYPFWQDLFPQLNESIDHFMDNEWAGPVTGGWVDDLPASYIREFGP